tara:strand:+ start:2032 stop:2352 length:321 start_codon:yes stop_codon:yes gene_type:complete
LNKILNQNKIGAESGGLITSTADSRLFTEFYDDISYNPVTALACINAYSISMKQINQNRMGGEPTARGPNVFEFMKAVEESLYFFANGYSDGAVILEGHSSKKEMD